MIENNIQPFYDQGEFEYSRLNKKQQVFIHRVNSSSEICFIASTGCTVIDFRALGNGTVLIDQLGTATDIIIPTTTMLPLVVSNPEPNTNFLEPNDLLRVTAPLNTLLTFTISY